MTVEEAKTLLWSSNSSKEWTENCRAVKESSDGHYPAWWYEEIIRSGFADTVLAKWGADTQIRVG